MFRTVLINNSSTLELHLFDSSKFTSFFAAAIKKQTKKIGVFSTSKSTLQQENSLKNPNKNTDETKSINDLLVDNGFNPSNLNTKNFAITANVKFSITLKDLYKKEPKSSHLYRSELIALDTAQLIDSISVHTSLSKKEHVTTDYINRHISRFLRNPIDFFEPTIIEPNKRRISNSHCFHLLCNSSIEFTINLPIGDRHFIEKIVKNGGWLSKKDEEISMNIQPDFIPRKHKKTGIPSTTNGFLDGHHFGYATMWNQVKNEKNLAPKELYFNSLQNNDCIRIPIPACTCSTEFNVEKHKTLNALKKMANDDVKESSIQFGLLVAKTQLYTLKELLKIEQREIIERLISSNLILGMHFVIYDRRLTKEIFKASISLNSDQPNVFSLMQFFDEDKSIILNNNGVGITDIDSVLSNVMNEISRNTNLNYRDALEKTQVQIFLLEPTLRY
ncbi:hypothetical protein [Photobacterium kishitanii]|uniref:Uncharacterized protein n=1 Tax=Photobacterium kishitanii TaxID=318456 RepID=A0A2T3KM05_9GAMM|nr:hypothetical protein [Photobacterium kishitanii]PSV00709.1 hypothetical protein C9J27_06090 [Photobacterium kishitanii]